MSDDVLDLDELLSAVSSEVRTLVNQSLMPVLQRAAAVEAECQAMKAEVVAMRDHLADLWGGTWHEGKAFRRGQFATYQGSVWHSNLPNNVDRPGTSAAWSLSVKQGKPAR